MVIEQEFEYDADSTEIADEFCIHDSEYQAKTLNNIGSLFKSWLQDKKRPLTYIQMLEIAEQLDEEGKWFIETLCDYMKGLKEEDKE